MKNKPTETKFKSALRGAHHLFRGAVCLGAVILICSSAPAQNLFVSVSGVGWGNSGRGSIYKLTPNGERTIFADGLNYPWSLAFDREGNLFVPDDGAIYKFTPAGVRTTFAAGLSNPIGLAFDSAGNLFVTDAGSGSILEFTPMGVGSTFASGLSGPVGLALDSAGNLFVTDGGDIVGPGHGHLYKFTPAGVRSTVASGFITPNSLAFDSAGNLFLVDGGDIDGLGGAIYEFSPTGVQTTFASADDFFIDEFGLVIDSANNLFVPDLGPGNIYKFTPAGLRSIFANIPSNLQSGVTPISLAFQPTPTPGSGQLQNISTRLRLETDDNVLIGGFIITGTQPKRVILRAIGPSLSSFFSGVLADPVLELHDSSGGLIASNDNWRSNQMAEIIATTIPPSNDLESAIVATLPANSSAYTAIVRGVNNGTGIGVVEAYDLDQTVDSKLANISTRGLVQTGNNVLIGGLIVLGQNPLRVIVRAIGPSLPVPGALEDPTLELHDGDGSLIASNDNWRSDQEAEIIATGIPPSDDLESAIVGDLVPGNYTAIVRGVDSTTGVALVEVYALN